jgi:predicted P-loop ATPase
MADNTVVPFPGLTETDRKRRLFEWADRLLRELDLIDQIEQASSVEDLRKITFDVKAVEVALAIQEALHPENGRAIAACFVGIGKRVLEAILKARFAEAKRLRAQGFERGENGAAAGGGTSYDWTDDLKLHETGAILPLLANLILFLRHHKVWEGAFGFDEFGNRVIVRKPSPAGSDVDVALTDHFESKVRCWFQREDIKAAQGDVGRAIQAVARDAPFHPVRVHFDALVWDGTPRIDTWLTTYLHADDTAYARAVGPRYLVSGVARIDQPGCQVDHTLVLEGPQGKLKSKLLRALAIKDEWFLDHLSHVHSKDAKIELAGKFIVELAEMDALTRATNSAFKAFLTQCYDNYRPPYGRHLVNLPRQCIFAGTINPGVNGYLRDPTGSRRVWPVTCHGDIDLAGFERDCDQIWAEAIVRYRAGAPWWLETPELEALATVEQRARLKVDVWQEQVEKWLGKRKDTSVAEALKGALKIAPHEQSRSAEMRVASILTNLGFAKYRAGSDGDRKNRYRRT